jgi:hypothetical protein
MNVALVHPSLSPFCEVSFKAMGGLTIRSVNFVNKVNSFYCLHVVCQTGNILTEMDLLEFTNFFHKGDMGYSTLNLKSNKKGRWFDKLYTSWLANRTNFFDFDRNGIPRRFGNEGN